MVRQEMRLRKERLNELRSKSRLEDVGLVIVKTDKWDLKVLAWSRKVACSIQEGDHTNQQEPLCPEAS